MYTKKIALFGLILIFCSCATQSNKNKVVPLYEILTKQSDGGASIRFFEVLTESKEIKMLENDENLNKKIKASDIEKCNFIILNMGEKTTAGNLIGIESVVETPNNIIVTVKDEKQKASEENTGVYYDPYTIVKINSKKEIIFK